MEALLRPCYARANASIIFLDTPHAGGIELSDAVIVPGLSHALVFDWNGDNAGLSEIELQYSHVNSIIAMRTSLFSCTAAW